MRDDSYGARFKACRVAAGLTQTQFASKVDLSRSSVANIEADRQRSLVDDVARYAEALGVEPAWLAYGRVTVGGSPPPRPPSFKQAEFLAVSDDLQNVEEKPAAVEGGETP